MKRVYPTMLKVLDAPALDENKKGYYTFDGPYTVQLGVRKNRIHIASPGNWYRTYAYVIDLESIPPRVTEDGDIIEEETPSAPLWRLISQLVKTGCGRSVKCQEGQRYVTVTHLSKKQAKEMYHLMKHILAQCGIQYTMSSSWISAPFTKAEIPDVREKARRVRRRTLVAENKYM